MADKVGKVVLEIADIMSRNNLTVQEMLSALETLRLTIYNKVFEEVVKLKLKEEQEGDSGER